MEKSVHIDLLLRSYPRHRPPLTPAHERVFAEQYRLAREGAAPIERLAQYVEGWMHRRVASRREGPILELGAGTLNHRRYEAPEVDYDVVEPSQDMFKIKGRPEAQQVRDFFEDIASVPADRRYRRVISIAVLEHMTNLPVDLAHAALRLAPGAVFQAGIPSEGGAFWWLSWRLSTGISYYIRTGLDYGVAMRHEHVNTAPEIVAIVRHFFDDVRLKRFPLPGHHLSLFTYVEAQSPRYDRCRMLVDNA